MSALDSRCHVQGTISSAGFAGGHRFVIGCWPVSPIGPFGDVMWIRPDGWRVLIVAHADAADFVTAIYCFDEVVIADLNVACDGRSTSATSPSLHIELAGGRARRLPSRRPLSFTRYVERPIAHLLLGVNTYGTSPRGVREWYQASAWRWVVAGAAALDGRALGAPLPFDRGAKVGFSDPPKKPSIVSVRVAIEPPARASGLIG